MKTSLKFIVSVLTLMLLTGINSEITNATSTIENNINAIASGNIEAVNCDDVVWQDHCDAVIDPEARCRVTVSGGICSFIAMSAKKQEPKPVQID